MTDPSHLRYTSQHEWIDTTHTPYRIGITAFAAEQLGDIVFVDLPKVGDHVEAGAVAAEIESTKSVGEVYAPVAGRVAAVNQTLSDKPETVNAEPYGAGWVLDVEPEGEPQNLLSAEQYAEIAK